MMNEEIKSWNDQHELILKQWGEAAACYRYMHHRAYLLYKKLSMRFTVPVIVLSTITGTANFAQSSFPDNMRDTAPAIIGGMNLIAGLIATVMQFLSINELMENHRTAALAHGVLSRNIRLILALSREERKMSGLKFVEDCKSEYDRLLEQSPAVPVSILQIFEKEYPLDNVFTKPEILKVRSIPVLKLPKTIEPIRAITESTPLASIGNFFAPKKTEPEEDEPTEEEEEEEYEEEEEEEEEEEQTDVEQGMPKE